MVMYRMLIIFIAEKNIKNLLYKYHNSRLYQIARNVRNCVRKGWNAAKLQHLKTLKQEDFFGLYPERFVIETVLGCNLACPECAVGAGLINRKYGRMSLDSYRIIADKLKPYAKELILVMWGEPLLNKDIFEIIALSAQFASRVCISTNGNLLDEAAAERLVKSGLTSIIVSIDGTTQEVYEKYRVGGSLTKALDGLRWLQEAKQKYRSKIIIIPQFIVFKHNQHQLEEFNALCDKLGLKADYKAPYLRDNSALSASTLPQYQRFVYTDKVQWTAGMSSCDTAWQSMTVLRDGTVVPCCCASNSDDLNFGNLLESDLPAIWDSEEFRRFRWQLIRGKGPQFCRSNCLQHFYKPSEE